MKNPSPKSIKFLISIRIVLVLSLFSFLTTLLVTFIFTNSLEKGLIHQVESRINYIRIYADEKNQLIRRFAEENLLKIAQSRVSQMLKSLLSDSNDFFFLDTRGIVRIHQQDSFLEKSYPDPELLSLLPQFKQDSHIHHFTIKSKTIFYSYYRPWDLFILYTVDTDQVLNPAHNVRNLLISASLLIILIAFIFAEKAAKKIAAPLLRLNQISSEIIANQFPQSWPEATSLEIQNLIELLKKLLQDLMDKNKDLSINNEKLSLALSQEKTYVEDMRKTQHELSKTKSYLSNVINSMPSALFSIDMEGNIIDANLNASAALNKTPAELQGKNITDLFPHYKEYIKDIKNNLQHREIFELNKLKQRNGDELEVVNLKVYPLITNGIDGGVIRIDNVTEQFQLEEMMIQSEKMLTVGGLAAGMAHEINNPLGIILQGIQNTLRRLSPELAQNKSIASKYDISLSNLQKYLQERKVIHYLEGIQTAGIRASKIVATMLNFSRKSDSKKQWYDLTLLLETSLDLAASDYSLKQQSDFRHIEIERHYAPGSPQLYCAPSELEQVFINLFKNAAQAMYEKKKTHPDYMPKITISTRQEEKMMVILIQDNGPGMPEATQKRIFEPFYSTKEIGMGTGLGLSVSYFIIKENHQGNIYIESTPETGASFIIELPNQLDSI